MKLVCVPLFAAAIFAQTPSFEVASVKPTRTPDGPSATRVAAGQFTMQNASLRKMTLMAYGIADDRSYALIGPGWLETERFDVAAKYPEGAGPEQFRSMLRNLLADRFKLAVHKETRQLPQYSLVVAKGGLKIQPAESGSPSTNGRPGRLEATRITMQKLADLFSRYLNVPVRNDTGVAGAYTFTLEWTPDEAAEPGAAPSLFAALQEQLGLKFEGRKGPIDVIVIDHMERTPTEN